MASDFAPKNAPQKTSSDGSEEKMQPSGADSVLRLMEQHLASLPKQNSALERIASRIVGAGRERTKQKKEALGRFGCLGPPDLRG